ncbi:hypothetical protein Tco_1413913, partial [Tanacetum coccineum]
MVIGTRPEQVDVAAITMGCSIFTTPLVHLGVKVGGTMYRIKSWDDVVARVSFRLSKWKLETLSIETFYNGVDGSERKMAWISWNKVLASKKYGGLGVSSFYALNRVWSLEATCEFSVKSIRQLIDDSIIPKEKVLHT